MLRSTTEERVQNGLRSECNPFAISDVLKEAQERHRGMILKLLRMGVSWWRIEKNSLDDPRLSEVELNELLSGR